MTMRARTRIEEFLSTGMRGLEWYYAPSGLGDLLFLSRGCTSTIAIGTNVFRPFRPVKVQVNQVAVFLLIPLYNFLSPDDMCLSGCKCFPKDGTKKCILSTSERFHSGRETAIGARRSDRLHRTVFFVLFPGLWLILCGFF